MLGQGELRFTDRDGRQTTNAAARISANFHRINLTSGLEWERQRTGDGKELAHFDLVTLASGRIGPVRVRGSGRWEISPQARLRSAEASAYWSASDNADWEVGVGYEALSRRSHARLSHIRRFNALAAAASVEAASDGSIAVGLNLNFSLDSSRGFRPVRDPLAGVGQVQARIFRDDNDNGIRDGSEAYEEGAMITAGTALALNASGKDGIASASGLAAYRPVAIGVDSSTLANPALTPRHALQMIVPRPGVTAVIDIPLVGAGDIEGALVKDDGSGIRRARCRAGRFARPHHRHRPHRFRWFFPVRTHALRRLRLPPDPGLGQRGAAVAACSTPAPRSAATNRSRASA